MCFFVVVVVVVYCIKHIDAYLIYHNYIIFLYINILHNRLSNIKNREREKEKKEKVLE